MKVTKFPEFDEILYEHTYKNGFTVFILRKKEIKSSVGSLGIKMGSIDECGKLNFLQQGIPQGTAHFMEHILFEKNNTNAFDTFNKIGTFINASTSFTETIYTIKTVDDYMTNIYKLLDYVMKPKFHEKSIEQERKIIEQENQMYINNYQWNGFLKILKNLFPNHPINHHIGGDSESLLDINKTILSDVHKYFYNYNNAILFLVTPMNPNKIFKNISSYLSHEKNNIKFSNSRNLECSSKNIVPNETIFAPLKIPHIYIGFRLFLDIKDVLFYEIILDIFLEYLIGDDSTFYNKMIYNNMINSSIEYILNINKDFAYIIINVKTTYPQIVINSILELLSNVKFDKKKFQKIKNHKLSSILDSSNSNTWLSSKFIKYYFKDSNFLEIIKIIKNITYEELLEIPKFVFENSCKTNLIINN
ncbi:insulinase family protein [Staphylococcus cohnii]|nr:insulinase family protein [Staphylococcus cohnii]